MVLRNYDGIFFSAFIVIIASLDGIASVEIVRSSFPCRAERGSSAADRDNGFDPDSNGGIWF